MANKTIIAVFLCLAVLHVEGRYTNKEVLLEDSILEDCLQMCTKCMEVSEENENEVEEHCKKCLDGCDSKFFHNAAKCKLYAGTERCSEFCEPCSKSHSQTIDTLLTSFPESLANNRLIYASIQDKCVNILSYQCSSEEDEKSDDIEKKSA